MMFPGYVPNRGEYNTTYIQKIAAIVEKSAEYGIYALLDMHQDAYAEKFCVDGFPNWMVNTGMLDEKMVN